MKKKPPDLKKVDYKLWGQLAWRWCLLPALLFFGLFFLFQPQYIGQFAHGFFLDKGDGYQNVWNVWWVNQSLTVQHVSPYFTHMLEWPQGTTLVPQTMNIFNGLMAIPLMHVLGFSLIEAVNFAVVFSFVMAGLTMFWFIQKLYGTYWVSLVAGCLYTFSSYHFAHALGHLQLVSFEWIPLFLLTFWTLLEKLRYRDAVLAAGTLFLVLLCDYYYLMWCVFLGSMWLAWRLYKKQLKLNQRALKVLGMFAGLSLVLVGPLMYQLWKLSKNDQLLGFHSATMFSLDPLEVLIPGGGWHWASLTAGYWKNLPYTAETSLAFGFGVLACLVIALVAHRRLKPPPWLTFWWITLFVFGILALGPRLIVLSHRVDSVPLPYAGLVNAMPSLKVSGMPIRWVLISLIAAIVITAFVLSKINLSNRRGQLLAASFILVSLVSMYPFRLPLSVPIEYDYIKFLKTQPTGGVIDNAAPSGPEQLYNQTEHQFPMAFGYVTRLPKDVDEKNFHIFAALEQDRIYQLCRDYRIRYVTLPAGRPLKSHQAYPIIYQDKQATIYDVKNSPRC